MRAALRIMVLGLISTAVAAPDAAAALGWLEKLSGPGDFQGPEFLIPFACYGEKTFKNASNDTPIVNDPGRETVFVDWDCRRANQRRFRAILAVDLAWLGTERNPIDYPDQSDPNVTLFWVIPTVSIPLHRDVRIAMGFGFGRFSGSDRAFDPFWRALYQPVRLAVTPFGFTGSNILRVVQVHVGLMMVVGDISARDFGGTGSLDESNEVVPHIEIALDLARLHR